MSSAETPDPMEGLLPGLPVVSMTTLPITGLLVDVYGLDELPATLTHASVLWLHNPRLGDKARMAPLAKHIVGGYNATRPAGTTRGLIAAAFDQRNHGSREVHHLSNLTWKKDNPFHAQDMFGTVCGTVVDTRLLIDALPGYLFLDRLGPSTTTTAAAAAVPPPPPPPPVLFDQHIVAGVSLGGHSTWQTMFTDPRVTAGVSIIGCPDYQCLIQDRARLSKRPTYDKTTGGAAFLGSRDFPPALVAQCAQFDPKAIVFGTQDVPPAEQQQQQQARLRGILDRHVKGKKFLLCTGGDDKLVPWRCSEAFTKFFVHASQTWYKDSGLTVDNRIYEGVGHECSDKMVLDAVRFVCEVVNGAGTAAVPGSKI